MTRASRVRPVRSLLRAILPVLALLLVCAPSPRAQDRVAPDLWTYDDTNPADADWSDAVPAHVAVVDGQAWLGRDGRTEPADENTPLLSGDRLRTARGRVDILFADGGALALDEDTSVEFLSDSLLRLDTGRIRLTPGRRAGATAYRIDAAGTMTGIHAAGEYRITTDSASRSDPDVRVFVIRGLAELTSPHGRSLIRAGYESERQRAHDADVAVPVAVASWDAFDRWVDRQRDERQSLASTSYLPTELRYTTVCSNATAHGSTESNYGYVWYPRVDVDWRPYAAGRWSVVGLFGWTWIGSDRWSWPTHHYGRWGVSGARWYWIPDRRWAPAWVSWASAPGYVGWCPLGFDNRPLVSINIGYASARRAWSHAPARTFQSGVVIASRDPIGPMRNDARFIERRGAPARPAGVRADNQPIRSPGRPEGIRPTAVPRASTAANRTGSAPGPAPRQQMEQGAGIDRRPPRRVGFRRARPRARRNPRRRGPRFGRRHRARVRPGDCLWTSSADGRSCRGRASELLQPRPLNGARAAAA